MTPEELTALSDEELLAQWKKAKTNNITIAVMIGLLVGTSVYGAVTKGFTFFSCFPLFLVVILANARKKNSIVEREIKSRNLK